MKTTPESLQTEMSDASHQSVKPLWCNLTVMGSSKKKKSQMTHLVMTLIKLDKDNPLQKALEHTGVSTPVAVLSLSSDDINELHHLNDNGDKADPFRWMKLCVHIL
jgi:hypothetical protein